MQITYKNKVTLQSNPNIPDENKVTAEDMNEIKSAVNSNEEEQQALSMSVQEIAQNVVNNSQEISNIKEEQTTQNENIQSNSNNISDLQLNKADKTEIPTDLSQLSNDNTKFVNETELENAIFQEKTQRQNADNNLQNQVDTNKTNIQTNATNIATNTQEINRIKAEQTTQNNRLNNLETDNTTNKSNISANTQEINNIKQEQTTQNTNISNNATNIETLQAENEKLKSIVAQLPQVTGQGTEVTLENTIEAQFTIFDVEGNSVQDGTPSPDNEVPIYSAGDNGSINEKIQTRNLWSSVWEQGYINANGVNENNSDLIRTKDYIYFEPEQKYAIKRSIATAYINVRGYDKNKRFVGTGSNVIVSYSGGADNPMQATIQTCVIATKPGVYYLRFNDASNNLSTEYMMVKGDTPEDYVPHEEQDYSIPVQQPMRSIRDVRDVFFKNTVDSPYYDENLVENGWYERHDINRKVFDGTEEIFYSATGNWTFRYKPTQAIINDSPSNYNHVKSNYFTGKPVGNDNAITSYDTFICFRYDMYKTGTSTEFKNWLAEKYASGNPVYVDYLLATPLNLPCTETQIQQLENKPSTYKEMTIINSEDETKAYLEVSGIYDMNKLITRTEVLESES